MDNFIKFQNVSYSYEDSENQNTQTVLKNISLEVKEGEFLSILGNNGSGKSTLAKLINGLIMPTAGLVRINGMITSDEKNIWDIRSTVGMVFQNPDNQFVATIVEEDVAFALENMGVDPEEIRKRVDDSLKQVGMYEYRRHAPHLLSGGQKQRVAIAGVLAMRPKCIVFDESTSMLDPSGRKEFMDILKDLNRDKGITIILITHHMDEAVQADRLIVIDDGIIKTQGLPRDVFFNVDLMIEMGMDVPQVTLLSYELMKNGIDIDTKIISIDEMVRVLCQLKSKI